MLATIIGGFRAVFSWFTLRRLGIVALVASYFVIYITAQRLERLSWVERDKVIAEKTIKYNQEIKAKEIVLQKKIIEIEGKYREKVKSIDSIKFTNGLYVNATCERLPTTSSDSSKLNREATCKLSDKDSEFIIGIAKEADRNTEQLNSLIDVIQEIRK